ncbi:MAG TPA: toxic anion resistance protein [Novosphingobium sp.]|nr:toxic anion resistance protein [Novosphingobium sp.]
MASSPDSLETAPRLTLTPPDPVPTVAPAEAAGLVPIDKEQTGKLDAKVDAFVADLLAQNPHSPEFATRVDQLTNMGRKEIAAAAGLSNRFLDRPVNAMGKEDGVGTALVELRRTVESLDPETANKGRKWLGLIPVPGKMQRYFDGYVSAQGHIRAILDRLARGKDELLKDNAAIDVERGKLWEAMGNLEQMIHIARRMDEVLENKAADLDISDPAQAKALRETALFYTRQRAQDLLTQMAVTVQGYLALDLVKRSNVELIKGVDRASTTTIAALRTAVTVAQALSGQRLVLQQITALNSTTAGIIDSTSRMLKEQSGAIHQQAAASTVPIEVLQRAFVNIYETMDSIDTFKLRALETMKQTVNTLSAEVDKSRARIARAEGANSAAASPALLSLEG